MKPRDFVFYNGPSLLTGDPVLGIVTGLTIKSQNPKTGPMAQAWILRRDIAPMDAKRQNKDDAVCGDCKLRGDGGFGSICYVPAWFGPNNVYKAYHRGVYEVLSAFAGAEMLRDRFVRVSAYGDPAALPFNVWDVLLAHVAGHVGYTHQWRRCDPRFKSILMASVDTPEEWSLAWASGWRTFRMRARTDTLIRYHEFVCPASDEGHHKSTCQACGLCSGLQSPARNVVIMAHGNFSAKTNFYKSRRAAEGK